MLIARQAEAFAADERMESRFGLTCMGVPSDIINFQHDALACAIALGWREGVTIEQKLLSLEMQDGYLLERIVGVDEATHGSECVNYRDSEQVFARLVTQIDGTRFDELWLRLVTAA